MLSARCHVTPLPMQGQDSPPMDPDHATLGPKARRMTAVATLARPVQHDINNLLTVVFANLELLKRTAAAGGPSGSSTASTRPPAGWTARPARC